jgi:hypothetical protein
MVRSMSKPRRRTLVLFGGVFTLLMALVAVGYAAGAGDGVTGGPLPVESASLAQDGQDLVWQVELTHPSRLGGYATTADRYAC